MFDQHIALIAPYLKKLLEGVVFAMMLGAVFGLLSVIVIQIWGF